MPILTRTLAGFVLALGIVLAARRARVLSPSGGRAALAVGTGVAAAGWSWGLLLMAFFVGSSLLSHLGRRQKQTLSAPIVAKGDERDAVQVLANGGLYAATAVGSVLAPSPAWTAIGAGAIAAATADTWATEIGMLAPRAPRSIVTGRVVPPGTSGGVTWLGFFGAVIGAGFIATVTLAVGWPKALAAAALAGGIAGSLADSLLGALFQQRRWCDRCSAATERLVHRCGDPTRLAGGVRWMDNDAVNAICTIVGGVVSLALAGYL